MEKKKHLYKKVVLMAIRKGISLKELKLAWIMARQRQALKNQGKA